ncbi:hypothetical protein [Leptolyngbya sp. FACHB-261]|uniref:hypothetical protein n=1 Tax=Leptolyngbya sp. FACHB-261 TaxID=2692806 RepID=UPI001688DC38|nr:hypothetical protein [Leptolyngbya sp. FACHB-261]MBD2104748.1 hypothetical protein [Leptolyngbya sp. FACHB-261]
MLVRLLVQECPFCGYRVFFHHGQLIVCSIHTGIATRSPCPNCRRVLDPEQWLIVDPLTQDAVPEDLEAGSPEPKC